MRNQKGYAWKASGSWYGRWNQNEVVDGVVVRRQHSERLCAASDKYRNRSDVQPLLDDRLKDINSARYAPESTGSVATYAEKHFLPYADAELKPSTRRHYRAIWNTYLKEQPQVEDIPLRDFRCVDTTKMLAGIHRKHGLSRKSLRHCKGTLSSLFSHARAAGVIDGINPATGAKLPRTAEKSVPTHAYTPQEVMDMMSVLTGVARTAVALMFFAALRPGEARGARLRDYDADRRVLHVRNSMFGTHLTTPKTEESCGVVPVNNVLANILDGITGSPDRSLLAGPSGKPADLHNLAARVVVPALTRCSVCKKAESDHAKATHEFNRDDSLPKWRGWYALRRGAGTSAYEIAPMAAKSLLRHKNIATTQQFYVKSVDAAAVNAVDKISALFDNQTASGRPN
jgi:integrase